MQIKEIESSGLKRSYQVVVPADHVQETIESELKQAGKNLKIPGFRPGFVPMKILKQRYGESVKGDVLNTVIRNSSGKLIQERNLRPALSPEVKVEIFEEGKDLSYIMSFELFPDVPEIDLSTIKLKRDVFSIDEKEIADDLKRIAEMTPSFKELPKDVAAVSGNVVEIDFKGMIDGKAFAGGSAEGFDLELGSGQFIDNFEEQLIGLKAGDDKIVKVTFPADYGSKELAGKEASFAVKINAVLSKEKSEPNDELAKKVGFEDLAQMRDFVLKNINNVYERMVRERLKKQLFDFLEKNVNFALPDNMVKIEFDNIWKSLKKAQQEGDASLKDKSDADLEKEYKEIAARRVKLGIFLADISNRNKLHVSKEDLMKAAFNQAMAFPGQERQIMDFYKKHPDRLDDLRGPVLEEKTVDFIFGKISYEDQQISTEELRKESSSEQ